MVVDVGKMYRVQGKGCWNIGYMLPALDNNV